MGQTEGDGERGLPARCVRHPAGYINRALCENGPDFAIASLSVPGRMPTTATKMVALPVRFGLPSFFLKTPLSILP